MTPIEWTPGVLTLDDEAFYLGEYAASATDRLRVRFHPDEAQRIVADFSTAPMWQTAVERNQIVMTNLDEPPSQNGEVYRPDQDGWYELGSERWQWRRVELTGAVQDALPYDTWSPASSQHYIDTGIYLPRATSQHAASHRRAAGHRLSQRQINTLFVVGQHEPVSAPDVAMHLLSSAPAELARLNRLAERGLVDRQYTGLKSGDRVGWNLTHKGRDILDREDLDDEYDPLEPEVGVADEH